MKYALFLGCTVPVRALNYELAARKVGEKLGLEFLDIPEFSCCGFPVKSVDRMTFMLMAAENLSLAEEANLDICTLCSACSSVLTEVDKQLKENRALRNRVNEDLSVTNRKYHGKIHVKHFVRILHEDVGLAKIKEMVKRPLSEFNFTAHYGCHYLKPSEVYGKFDEPENPRTLDELIRVTGAQSIPYEDKNECCGGGVLGVEEATALKIAALKLDHIKASGADALVLICPFCNIMYEGNQKKIERQSETEFNLPVLYYPQVLGLALGIPPDELGFRMNRVKPREILSRLG
ncbi:CoB--CoM heterodisulfide reductase subunit B [Candidatus Aerophobetes bacterium]|uniref:CoB--CoM heterodisulfide reductase subunit B n=1 Tax=Aerophobetes bacterium TaxID=2030807 RepID=A0A523W241_UNCAE|nr:MAG: CoB--CoM heterodisulfide reductase subunit B [Candidatus Aerophobetes bacterium]